ncbi:hypothetical protein VNI00_004145 [Paramarasmius palmivorus]|uniref:F-box domain-containing protein n=1 Tax=Paramarasmius palmivorus TaxID=297713 RepID=A0AAW0DK25_9AGAR
MSGIMLPLETLDANPISRIPADVLVYIFMLCVQIQERGDWIAIRYYGRRWFSFSHVCQTWREIALGCASLWTKPDFNFPYLAKQMLERSKPALLDIEFEHDLLDSEKTWSIKEGVLLRALLHPDRIQSLRLRLRRTDKDPAEKLLSALTKINAPSLRLLEVHVGIFCVGGLTLPHGFFEGNTPRLSHLQLHSCIIPSASPLLSNLTHLRLLCISQYPSFLNVLRKTPLLVSLEITFPCPELDSDGGLVFLPHLQRLHLTLSFRGTPDILFYLSFPETTQLFIECQYRSPSQPWVVHSQIMMNAITSLVGMSTHREIKTLALRTTGPKRDSLGTKTGAIILEAWNSDVSTNADGLNSSSPPHLQVQLSWEAYHPKQKDPPIPYAAGVKAALGGLPLPNLESFYLNVCLTLDMARYDIIKECLESLRTSSSLRKLHVLGDSSNQLYPIYGMMGVATTTATAKQGPSRFPALETLSISHLDYRYAECAVIKVLSMCGRQRKLVIRHCRNVTRADITFLEKYIEEVEWDESQAMPGCWDLTFRQAIGSQKTGGSWILAFAWKFWGPHINVNLDLRCVILGYAFFLICTFKFGISC